MLAFICLLACVAQFSANTVDNVVFDNIVLDDSVLSQADSANDNSVKALLNVLVEPYYGLVDDRFGEIFTLPLSQAIANQPDIVKTYVNFKYGDKVKTEFSKNEVKAILYEFCVDRISELNVFDDKSGDLQSQLVEIKDLTRSGEFQETYNATTGLVLQDGSIGFSAGEVRDFINPDELCPGACESNGMTWSGQWTFDSQSNSLTCFCNDQNAENQESPDRAGVNEAQCQKLFCDAMVKQHNVYRAKHGARALQMDQNESRSAQQWAKVLASEGRLRHSRSGQNLAMFGGQKPTLQNCANMGKVMTDMWYDEIRKYNFRRQGFSMETGHFTQVVWKGSTRLGCGVAISNGNSFWGVGHYSPAGNVMGQFEKNVSPPSRQG